MVLRKRSILLFQLEDMLQLIGMPQGIAHVGNVPVKRLAPKSKCRVKSKLETIQLEVMNPKLDG